MKKVSIITLNKNRTDTLLRVAKSIKDQDYGGHIQHIIIGDASKTLPSLSYKLLEINPKILIHNFTDSFPQEVNPIFLLSKIGYLRNLGVSLSTGDYVSQIADDDFIHSNHISSLVRILDNNPDVGVAYSWRRTVDSTGNPLIVDDYPWAPNARHIISRAELSKFIFHRLVSQGVREVGSPVIKDAVLAPDGEEIFTVDTNCMMVRREIHKVVPWKIQYTWREICGDYSDDHRFVESCYRLGIKFKCTEMITYDYSMGGVSQPN